MSQIIDYSDRSDLTFAELRELEMQRQGIDTWKLERVKVKVKCEVCGKPYVAWLHSVDLALSFTCSEECYAQLPENTSSG
jgi:hypothetical protein